MASGALTTVAELTSSDSAAVVSMPFSVKLVAVTAPEKRADESSALARLSGKKVVAFAVPYRSDLPPFAAAPAGAPRRRFRDFVALAARLVRCAGGGDFLDSGCECPLTLKMHSKRAGGEPPRLFHPAAPREAAGGAAGRQARANRGERAYSLFDAC